MTDYKKAESACFDALSLWVRMSYEINGYVHCFTCDDRKPVKGGIHGIHAGHYVSRKAYKTMFHLDNIRPQCYECNVNRGGNRKEFEKRLNLEREGKAQDIILLSNTIEVTDRNENVIKAMAKNFRKYPKENTWVIGGEVHHNIADFEKYRLIQNHRELVNGWGEMVNN